MFGTKLGATSDKSMNWKRTIVWSLWIDLPPLSHTVSSPT